MIARSPALYLACATAMLVAMPVRGEDETGSPIQKVVQMIGGLEAKIIQEGETAHAEYASFAEWCEDTSKNLQYEIKTSKGWITDLKAVIEKASATIEELTDKIEDLAEKAATADKNLRDATKVREDERADFVAEERELMATLSALRRAVKIISEEMDKGGAAMLQYSHAGDVAKVLGVMVQASVLNSADGDRLAALVQATSDSAGDDDDAGAPAAASYQSQSGGIVEVLEGLQEKAEEQLAKARDAEQKAKFNFETLKQSLVDESSVAAFEMQEAKNNVAANKEKKGVAEGDLDVTSKDLADDEQVLAKTHRTCMKTAEDYETSSKSRDEELAALAAAKKVIKETTGGADAQALPQVSFLQLKSGAGNGIERFLLGLAKKQQSKNIAKLARRISSTMRFASARGQDPFAKVKGLISEMIDKLEKAQGAEAGHKAYCDKETKESKEKEDDKNVEIKKLDTAIDEASSRIAVLQEEVAVLTKELADITTSQKEQDTWFSNAEATFKKNKEEMETGIKGVQLALKVLKDYYAQNDTSGSGAASGIIGLLETVESDFTQGLSEMESVFSNQQAAYQESTQDNTMATTVKNQDVKYKNQEMTNLQKVLKETSADRAGVQTELDAVMQYLAKIEEQCVVEAEPYEAIKARRDKEIAGLKEGLQVLEGGASSFLQISKASLRGA